MFALGGVIEGQQVGQVSEIDSCRKVADTELLKSDDPELIDEHVDQAAAHVRRVAVQLEESSEVALLEAVADLHGVLHGFSLLVLGRERLQHARRLCL